MTEKEIMALIANQPLIDSIEFQSNGNIELEKENYDKLAMFALSKTGLYNILSQIPYSGEKIKINYFDPVIIDTDEYEKLKQYRSHNEQNSQTIWNTSINEAIDNIELLVINELKHRHIENKLIDDYLQNTYVKPFTDAYPNVVVNVEMKYKTCFTFDTTNAPEPERVGFKECVFEKDDRYIKVVVR